MAYKMKGSPMQRNFPNDIKPSPTKWIGLAISAIASIASAAASASQKSRERNEARQEAIKNKLRTQTKSVGDARKVEKFSAKGMGAN
jgi:hypothetical protein